MRALLDYLIPRTPELLADIERVVRTESPSGDIEGLDDVLRTVQGWLEPLGAVERRTGPAGDTLLATVPGRSAERAVLLAHADTVYPRGVWATGWRVEGDRAFGPGVNDMKGGLVQGVWALRALRELGLTPARTVELLVTPDEEVGSRTSRALIEERARGAAAVLVLEPPVNETGALKVARKGVGVYRLSVQGRAAHQGTEPEKGVNAIVAAAEVVQRVVSLQDLEAGTTLGPNTIRGGTTSNVVADRVELDVDLRVWSAAEAERVDASLRSVRPDLEGARLEVAGGLNRPPMEPTEASWALYERARALGLQFGLDLAAGRVGGGSDGNFTAPLAPTLDGFGARGEAAHQRDLESLWIPELAPRTALIAAMLLEG